MACVFNLFVLSLTLLATITVGTITVGSRQFDALDKKIDALEVMMDIKIEMIKQDLAMVVKNLTMSVIGELQGTNGNINTFQIANTMGEDPKCKIQAAEDVYKVIQRGFSSEKMALKNSFSIIEKSVAHVQSQLEDVKEDLADIARNVMTKSEILTQLQLINAEISRNKNDIEAKVVKAKQDAILKSNEDCKTSNMKLNGELSSMQTNFTKIVNDVKKDVADINGRVMTKSETLTQLQLINAEISRNKNDIEAKVVKAKQDAILTSNEDCKTSNMKLNGELSSIQTNFTKIVNDVKKDVADINGRIMTKSETLTQLQLINAEISRNKNDIEAKVVKAKQDAILKSNEDCKTSNMKLNGELSSMQTNFTKIVNDVKKDVADINGRVMTKSETLTQLQLINAEISRNKNDIEAKVVKAKQDAILTSNEDCKTSNMKLNGELSSMQTNFTKIVNDVKKDVADINGRIMTKSETLTQLQLINAEISRSKNDIEAKVVKAKQDAILKSNEDWKTSNIKFSGELSSLQTHFTKIVNDVKKNVADIGGSIMNKSETQAKFQLLNAEINKNKNDIEAKVTKVKEDVILKANEDCKMSIISTSFKTRTYGNSIYFSLESSGDYWYGRDKCIKYGAHLPIVTTAGENNFLVNKFNARMFLGATDLVTEGRFVWEKTGQVVGFTDWDAWEPNNANGGEHCLEIYRSRWNDGSCWQYLDIVCELEI